MMHRIFSRSAAEAQRGEPSSKQAKRRRKRIRIGAFPRTPASGQQ
jgi:hypothetical protein